MVVVYRFQFIDSGEIWELDDNQYLLRSGYWMKRMLHEMKWFRWFYNDECDRVSMLECYHDERYYGCIGVGDYTVTWCHSPRVKDGRKFSYCSVRRNREHDGSAKICNC